MLEYIIQHISSSGHFKFIGASSPKLCKFKINYFDKIEELYKSSGLVHGEQEFKCNVQMGIVSTPNTSTPIESK